MAGGRIWQGVLREYADRLGVTDTSTVVTLGEGGTPLIPAPSLSERTGAEVHVKFEGMNPTGSFKDRGMTVALSRALEHGAKAVICASIEGQKTAAYEIVEQLGDAPDIHIVPVGNAGNYTAYARGYREEAARGAATTVPRMFGFQAEGAAPLVRGEIVRDPETVASAIRIGDPASWEVALEARDATDGWFGAIEDARILAAQKLLAGTVGVFVEPASAISVAGLLDRSEAGAIPRGSKVVLTVTGHGLKDPQWALRNPDGTEATPTVVEATTSEVAAVLDLERDA